MTLFGCLDARAPLRRVDPRVKLVGLLLAWVLAFALDDPAALAGLVILVGLVSAAGGIGLRALAGPSLALGLVGLQLLIIQAVFGREGAVLFSVGPLALHGASLAAAGTATERLAILGLSAFQFVRSTPPEELVLTLVWMRMPYRYASLAGFALRFLPLMESELRAVLEAQAARGLNLSGPIRLLRSFPKTVTPLLLRGLRRAEEASVSLELRGFGSSPSREFVTSLGFGPSDALALAAVSVLFAVFLAAG